MALDSAEKQRRYRERRKAGMPPARYRRHLDRRSKPQRWRDAVEVLLTLQADYREWFDNLPENPARHKSRRKNSRPSLNSISSRCRTSIHHADTGVTE